MMTMVTTTIVGDDGGDAADDYGDDKDSGW